MTRAFSAAPVRSPERAPRSSASGRQTRPGVIPQRTLRTHQIVILAPAFKLVTHVGQRKEHFDIQSVEVFAYPYTVSAKVVTAMTVLLMQNCFTLAAFPQTTGNFVVSVRSRDWRCASMRMNSTGRRRPTLPLV